MLHRALLFLFTILTGVLNAQKTDSTQIATFFIPQNAKNVTGSAMDSLFSLVKAKPKLTDIYYFHEARFLLQTGQFDLAKEKSEKAIKNLPKSTPPFAKVKFINVIASVHANKQESKKAIALFEKALRISDEAEEVIQASLLRSNIANMYFSLVDYESAYKYVSEAFEVMKDHPEHSFYSSMAGVLSISEAKIGKMKEAKKHGQLALKNAEKTGNLVAIIVSNLSLGEVANSEKDFELARTYLNTSLELSEKYQQRNFVLLNSIGLMAANNGLKNYTKATVHGEKALSMITDGGDKTTIYSIKKYLAEAYFGIGKHKEAYQLMRESHAVFKDNNSIENKKAINDILVKYDTERKEKELAESKNELLQKRIERTNLLSILGVLFFVIIGLVVGNLFIRNRNKNRIALLKVEQDKELLQAVFDGEELERERIATELHDGVASNLTAVRYQLMQNDNIPKGDKEQLEGIILQAHEDTRRLSHNLAPIYIEKYGFQEALQHFVSENLTDKCAVNLNFISSGENIAKEKAKVLYRVAQELTQNAIKHAKAEEITLQVSVNEKINLIVEDDGVGFDSNISQKSNGLESIRRRAEQLNGSFEIDSSPGRGTTTIFSIPLDK